MMTIEEYDTTQLSMRKAWKAEFHEFLRYKYRHSAIDEETVFKAIGNVDNFIKKHILGDKMLYIKDVNVAQNIKDSLLSHRSFAMGGTPSENDPRVIVLKHYIEYLQSKTVNSATSHSPSEQTEEELQKATEGVIKEVTFFRSVRNRKIRNLCAERDKYTCQVCGFNFEKVYGERGKGFIEIHHKNPMANFDKEHEIKLEDLVALCSNCHSMIHYGGEFLDVDDLKKLHKAQTDQ